jgi:hypothetical protein
MVSEPLRDGWHARIRPTIAAVFRRRGRGLPRPNTHRPRALGVIGRLFGTSVLKFGAAAFKLCQLALEKSDR